nr:retrotransposon Orf1 [Tanacetum cinerariifolium]
MHFVYTITISSKEDEPREIEIVKRDTKENDHETIVKVEEKSKESKNKKGEEKDDSKYIDTNPPSPPDPSVSFIIEKFYFMIVEDISSIIDPRLSQVMLGKPFVEVSNMTHDLSIGIVKFTIMDDEIAHKMPHKIEQFNSLSDLEK